MTTNCSRARCKVCKKNFVQLVGDICSDCSSHASYPEDNFSNAIPEYQCDICDSWVTDILMSKADQKICEGCWGDPNMLTCKHCGKMSPDFENDFHYHDLCVDCYHEIREPPVLHNCTECGDIIGPEATSRSICDNCASRMDVNLLKSCKSCNEKFRAFNYPQIADICKYCLAKEYENKPRCRTCGRPAEQGREYCRTHEHPCPNCNERRVENKGQLCSECSRLLDDQMYDSNNR